MNKQDVTRKLAATEASLKRWQTRLKRASTQVHTLDKQRRRYQQMLAVPVAEKPRTETLTLRNPTAATIDVAEVQRHLDAAISTTFTPEKIAAAAAIISEPAATDLDLPSFLNRKDPDVERSAKEARKKAELEAAKKTMPLNDKAALALIRSRRKRASKSVKA